MRDQLDRFGEIDHTASLLHAIASATTDGIVINRDDPRLGTKAFTTTLKAPLASYGVSEELLHQFPSDDEMYGTVAKRSKEFHADDTSLLGIDGQTAKFSYGGEDKKVTLKITGLYNTLNAVGAVALTRMVMKDELKEQKMLDALSKITPAFGRGEKFTIGGHPCELVLVKNPSGFRLGLQSFDAEGVATMIAINDNYADGRDMSWLWDVSFETLKDGGVSEVTGIRAYDFALRLMYDEVPFTHVDTNLGNSLREFLGRHTDQPKRIYCTYTAMLALRRELSKYTHVEVVS
jgi:UDP-N-acetylmuramyl tripeptide synthase